MAIKKLPQKSENDFISGAPDAKVEVQKAKGVFKGNKRQITLTITPELLAKIDSMAKTFGQGRAALINLAIHQAIERGFDVNGFKK